MEQQIFRKGRHKIPSLLDYKLATTLDTPEIETILVSHPDLEGPFGGKEAGQGPLNPVIPAIVNAVYDAIGVHIDSTPITADKIARALKNLAQGKGETLAVSPTAFSAAWPTRLIKWQQPAQQVVVRQNGVSTLKQNGTSEATSSRRQTEAAQRIPTTSQEGAH